MIEIEVAHDVAMAATKLASQRFDCVLLDRAARLEHRRAVRAVVADIAIIVVRQTDPAGIEAAANRVQSLFTPPATMAEPGSRAATKTALHAPTILVVDDDQAIRRALVRALRPLGANVVEAEDATGALERIRAVAVDMVISDYTLAAGTNGLQLLAEIRSSAPTVRRVLLTGHSLDDGLAGDVAVAEHVIQKPWQTPDLLDDCRRLLG